MKNWILIFCLLFSIGFISNLNAQKKVDYFASVGYPIGFKSRLDYGAYFAINPHLDVNRQWAVEGHLSYLYGKHNEIPSRNYNIVKLHSASATGGFRFKFRSEVKKVRPYINTLLGIYYFEEHFDQPIFDETIRRDIGLGFSIGFFTEIGKRFVIGVSGEKPDFLVGRIGFNF